MYFVCFCVFFGWKFRPGHTTHVFDVFSNFKEVIELDMCFVFFGKSGLDQVTTPMCFICLSPKMLKISEKAQNHKKCQKSQKMLKICKNVKNHRKRRKGKYLQKVWKIMNFTKNAENHQNAKNNQNAKDHRNY